MTTDIIELSKQAAEVLGVPPCGYMSPTYRYAPVPIWLAEDSGRCAEIAADRRISTNLNSPDFVETYWWTKDKRLLCTQALLADHNNDRLTTWRVAVLKAVIEQGKQ